MSPTKIAVTGDLCAAINSSNETCNARTKDNSKWCLRHDEERIKLYINYKSHHAALSAFPERTICQNIKSIVRCSSLDVIRAWNKSLISKYQLLNRCIGARAYFTERFFGNDMDFGHKTFWHCLIKQRAELENLMMHVEKRAYELILASQNALWVLERQTDPLAPSEECSGHEDQPLRTTSSNQTTKIVVDRSDIEDPLDVALRQKCQELWEKIRTRLARYCAPVHSRYYLERIEVICACVRRAIYTDPALMLVAQNYQTVMSFLKDSNLDISSVEKLWHAIKHLYVHDVRAAIDDVLRPKDGGGKYVVVLGARVYKDLSGLSLPFHAWGHMTAYSVCYSCVRKVCKTVDDIVALTRFVVLTGGTLRQSRLKYDFGFKGSRTLVLCGFIPNAIEDLGPRYSVSKCNCMIKRNTPHWEETKNNFVVCAGLSLNDPKSQVFVNTCLRDSDFMVMVRKGQNGRIIRSTEKIWASGTRRAPTRAALKKVPWEFDQDWSIYGDTLLEEAQPLISNTERIQDCFQVAIVDSSDGELQDLVHKLVMIWLKVYEVEDVMGLVSIIGNPYIDGGEVDVNVKQGENDCPLVSNLELDVLSSYKRLWGTTPPEGLLMDDERV